MDVKKLKSYVSILQNLTISVWHLYQLFVIFFVSQATNNIGKPNNNNLIIKILITKLFLCHIEA